jgi:hypothetical protein
MSFDADPSSPGRPQLVDVNSPAYAVLSPDSHVVKSIHTVLFALEASPTDLLSVSTLTTPCHCHLLPFQNLQVKLPRYKLSFFVNVNGELECKDLPGFYVSAVQSIGTLCGLASKLILETADDQGIQTHKVIIPDGTDKVFRGNDPSLPHPRITITPSSDPSCHIRAFVYDVDSLIGRLVGDGTQTSWYLLAYLHILTSYWLSDTLTHRTGVQQALQMLRSANSFSFMRLTDKHVKILSKIVNITPVRKYYPDDPSVETVTWDSALSPLSQVVPYTSLVGAIVDHGKKQELFHPRQTLRIDEKGTLVLRERAEFRNTRLMASDLQDLWKMPQGTLSALHLMMSLMLLLPLDVPYVPSHCLDISVSADNERRVMEAASLVLQWPIDHINVVQDLWNHFKVWRSFSSRVDPDARLDSPRTWLLEQPSHIWFSLLSLCQTMSPEIDLYGMTFALGILAYRSDFSLELSQSLLAVATHNSQASFKTAARFPIGDFDLRPGHTLELQEIQSLAEHHCIKFNNSHQLHLMRQDGETRRAFESRREGAHQLECEAQCQSLATALLMSWPSASPHMPTNLSGYSLIDTLSFRQECGTLFSSRFDNYCLFQHTTSLQAQLNFVRDGTFRPHDLPVPPSLPHFELPRATYVPVTLHTLMKDRDIKYQSMKIDASATRNLLSRLSDGPSRGFIIRYTEDLLRCVDALECQSSPIDLAKTFQNAPPHPVQNVCAALIPNNLLETILFEAGLWPSTGPENLLVQLSLHLRQGLSDNWRSALIWLAENLAAQQQAMRLNTFKRLGLDAEYHQEAKNSSGQGWDMLAYPDWLLIQLDANLIIRPVQASVAKAMMAPESQTNTVMQLNMGDGKSSVSITVALTH